MRYVVVCTLGRSGSTLLQGILNGVDGCCIRGENGNFLLGIFEAYRSIGVAKKAGADALLPTHPWHGGGFFDQEKFMDDARRIFNSQLSFPTGTKIGGFKEIRWQEFYLRGNSLTEYMKFLDNLLQNLKFIFLTRDLNEVYLSQIRAGFDQAKCDYKIFAERAECFYSEVRSIDLQIFEIDYRDIASVSPKMIEMFRFLEMDFDRDKIESILATEHSYANAKK